MVRDMADFKKSDFLGDKKIHVRKTPLLRDGTLLHCHPHQQISICVKGRGVYTVGKNQYHIREGDVILIYRLESHKCLPDGNLGGTFLMIELSEDFIVPRGGDTFQYGYLQPFRYDPDKVDKKISYDTPVAAEIRGLAEKLKALYDGQPLGYEHEMDASVKLIMSKLRSYFLRKYPAGFLSKHSNSIAINQAVAHINSHFLENLKTEDIARLAHLSPSRFRQIFKETMHISVKSYIVRLRISEVQRLLSATDMIIEDVAATCNFSNMSHFYRIFEQFVHMTPSEYRKASRQFLREDTGSHFHNS
jgi:AraC-like DNA-binding protein